jgi:hypothetical protein
MAKAHRGSKRARRPPARVEGGAGREHWRADGQPKTRFPTQHDANRASLRHRLEEGADLDPYRCGFCGGWHLGNRTDRD